MKNLKKKTDQTPYIQFQLFIFYKPACSEKISRMIYIWLSRLLPQNLENNSIEFQLIFELARGRKFSGEQ